MAARFDDRRMRLHGRQRRELEWEGVVAATLLSAIEVMSDVELCQPSLSTGSFSPLGGWAYL
jgi:hypothetical protein